MRHVGFWDISDVDVSHDSNVGCLVWMCVFVLSTDGQLLYLQCFNPNSIASERVPISMSVFSFAPVLMEQASCYRQTDWGWTEKQDTQVHFLRSVRKKNVYVDFLTR